MSGTHPHAESWQQLGELAGRAAPYEHIPLTDRGIPAADLVSPAEL